MKLAEIARAAINNDSPYSEVILVTPAKAAMWLENNTQNRRIKRGWVDVLKKELTADRWKLTHQGIAFASDGTLLDGQHRLTAVVESGVSAMFVVWFNMPKDSRAGVDLHARRGIADVATLIGNIGVVQNDDVAVIRAMVLYSRGNKKNFLSHGEMLDLVDRHIEASQFARTVLPKMRYVGRASTRAAIARAWYSVDHDVLHEFGSIITSGVGFSGSAKTVRVLTRWLMSFGPESGGGGAKAETLRFLKTQRALKAFVDGEVLTKIYPAAVEYFPLPEEVSK